MANASLSNYKQAAAADDLYLSHCEEMEAKFVVMEGELSQMYEHVPFGYHNLDAEGFYLSINSQELSWLGWEREEVVGTKSFVDFLLPDSREKYTRHFSDFIKCGYIEGLELDIVERSGRVRPVLLSAVFKFDAQSDMLGMRSVLFDMTEHRKAEVDRRIAAIAFETQEGILITDAKSAILRVNSAFTKITGYEAIEVVGLNPRLLQSGRQSPTFYLGMWECIKEHGFWAGEIWNKRKNGEVFPERLTISAVKDEMGCVTNYVATLADTTISTLAAEEIKSLAYYDQLTHLPNRRLLIERIKLSVLSSTRSGKQGAVLFLDLDNFKALNDTLGHDMGDMLLQQAAGRIAAVVREGDTVARQGGDEFIIVLDSLSENPFEAAVQTEIIGAKLLAVLGQPYLLAAREYRCTASIGATLFKGHQTQVDDLCKQADIAMYQAKKVGRNALRFFDPEMQASISARAKLEYELRTAIEQQQFQLHFQVQVDNTGCPLGAEALIRWQHPSLGLLIPSFFIPLAEETGLILPIGKWVLDAACAQLKIWQQSNDTRHLTMSVNVSSRQFHEADFVASVKDVVQRHGLSAEMLKLEPTESILLENIPDTVKTMNSLKEIGIHFALDDFGTGFSSLQYLKKLPLNQLKIDQSFVRDLASDEQDRVIVRTIIAMAKNLNLQVIAEGVETIDQMSVLTDSGCNHFQGHLFGKPMPVDEFVAALKTS